MRIYSRKLLFLPLLLLGIGIVGFFVWSKFFCPTCLANEINPPSQNLTPSLQISQPAPQIGSQTPHFVLKDLNNKAVSLADFKGKNVLLVFWATWCGFCAREKEDLKRFTDEQRGKIEVIAIDNERPQVLLDYVSREEINFMILVDENRATFEKYQVLGTPAHFLINKKSEIVAKRPGYVSYADLLMLAQTLEEK